MDVGCAQMIASPMQQGCVFDNHKGGQMLTGQLSPVTLWDIPVDKHKTE